MKYIVATIAAALVLLTGCDSLSDEDDGVGRVGVAFQVAPSTAKADQAKTDHLSKRTASLTPLLIEGTNGTLEIDRVAFIVTELELEGNDDACEELDDECAEFESEAFFVDLELDGEEVLVATSNVDAGMYEELEFEVENLDFDEEEDEAEGDDPDEEEDLEEIALREVADRIRTTFPEWPDDASLLVDGRFTPTGGGSEPFRAFFEAEVEVEQEFDPPLVLDDAASQTVTVNLDPAVWFKLGDGTVLDLAAFDFGTTGRVSEFEVEIEQGFVEIEHEPDDDDDEDDDEDENDEDDD